MLYGGSALSASAAAAYRALGVSVPARTPRTPYAVRGGNLPRLQAATSRLKAATSRLQAATSRPQAATSRLQAEAATSRVQVTLLSQYGQTEIAGMVLLGSPQAPAYPNPNPNP